MDLWIRSQDKLTLRRCNSLKIEKWENKYAIVEQATVYGTYKTKEEALKVIDKIILYFAAKSISTASGQTGVFYMPEDIEETRRINKGETQ